MTRGNVLIVPDASGAALPGWLAPWLSLGGMCVLVRPGAGARCGDWVRAIEHDMRVLGPQPLVVALGLGCLALAHWAAGGDAAVAGALLVGVAAPNANAEAAGFFPMPPGRLGFPSIVVAQEGDSGYRHALDCASAWSSSFVAVQRIGEPAGLHGEASWDDGLQLLESLRPDRP